MRTSFHKNSCIPMICIALLALSVVVSSNAMAQGTWQSKAALPSGAVTNGGAGGGAVINGVAYFLTWPTAGYPSPNNSLHAYNPATDAWTLVMASTPFPMRTGVRSVVINNRIYIIGGSISADGNRPANDLLIYDPATNSWSAGAPMPTSRHDVAAAAINGKIYVAGGNRWYPYNAIATLEIYDPQTNTWSTGAPMLQAADSAVAGALNGKLYVASGASTNQWGPTKNLQIYDPATNIWAWGPQLAEGHWSGTGGVVDGKLVVIGGWHTSPAWPPTSLNPNTEVFDPASNTWAAGTPDPVQDRFGANAASSGSQLFVVGGLNASNGSWATGPLEIFSLSPAPDPCAALQAALDAANAQIAQLEASVATLTAQVDTLSAQNATLATQVDTLTSQNAALTANLNTLQGQIAALGASLGATFGRPNFQIPGNTLSEQVHSLWIAIGNLNHGQLQALFFNLGGSKR